MATTRVWNISDDPNVEAEARTMLLFGKQVPPGRFVEVDEDLLETAHKLKKEVSLGHIFIGKVLPARYAKFKTPPRALLSEDAARAHGGMPADAIAKDASAKLEKVFSDTSEKKKKKVTDTGRPFESDSMKVSLEATLSKKSL